MIDIRPFRDTDWATVWPILQSTFSAGDTYAFDPSSSEADIRRAWIDVPQKTFIAVDASGAILGTYFIKANQPGLGSHVCNCGYVVAARAQGQGIATLMCERSQAQAIEMGFRAMQFNLVVSTNERAVALWQRLGFEIVGTLPGAFHHRREKYVDAFVMFKVLAA
jgi:ribosomal protein S18 acetylase RimI-like enzyme